jgi:hypothetical protein
MRQCHRGEYGEREADHGQLSLRDWGGKKQPTPYSNRDW